jgi:hypothetical protein
MPNAQQLQRIWAIDLMEIWFSIWDNLLRLFVPIIIGTRVANPKIRLNLVPNHLQQGKVTGNFQNLKFKKKQIK